MLLEARCHPTNSFATLTYREEELTWTQDLPTLVPSDLRNWLKRFRKAIEPSKLRFYAAGEYGDRLERPHYHVVLFGYAGCRYGKSRYRDGRTLDCCAQCDRLRDTWGLGIVQLEPLTPTLMAYAAGYVMKKMTHKSDVRLKGRYPEFQRVSLKPGLGAASVPLIAETYAGRQLEDVPTAIRAGGKLMPLGRYLRRQLRIYGGGDGSAPEHIIKKMETEMLPLLQAAQADPENLTLKRQIIARCQGEVASIKAKMEIFNSRKRNETL